MVGMKIDIGGIRALRFTVSERALWLEDEKTGERIRLGDNPCSASHWSGRLLGDVLMRADTWLVMNGTYGLGMQPMKFMDEYNKNITAPLKAALAEAQRANEYATEYSKITTDELRKSMKEADELRARLVVVTQERDAAMRDLSAKTKDVEKLRAEVEELRDWIDDEENYP